MAEYTIVVDDSNGQIIYGPGKGSWTPVNDSSAYQGTVHQALTGDAHLTFPFVGGQQIAIRGNFIGDNNASDSATYPVFQVDSLNLNCSPNPPRNGGQFFCSTSLPSTITNRTLSMFVEPNVGIQQFHIDYIRYGSSSKAAQAASAPVEFVQSPDNSTRGLFFEGAWEILQSLGDANDVKSAMQTSTPSSKATYPFVGDSFAWWSCCMPPATSSNAANGSYRVDGGEAVSFQIDECFIQSAQCKNERVLFQTHPGQLQPGNHTLEVVYNGDDSKMPLTLCALAATQLDFSALDVHSSSSDNHHSSDGTGSNTGIIAGLISGLVVMTILSAYIIWCCRKRAKHRAQEKRLSSTDSLLPFVFHPVVGFLDMDKRMSTVIAPLPVSATPPSANIPTPPPISNEEDGDNRPHSTNSRQDFSRLESRPPSYCTTRSLLNS